jgi:hypothetical protein
VTLCPPFLGHVGVKIEASSQCYKELSVCCAAAVPRMFFSCWYTLPTPSVEGASNVSKSAPTTTMFWLALAKVGSYRSTRSIVVAWLASSIDSHWCSSASLASMVVCSSASSPFHCMDLRSMLSYRAHHHSSW